MSVVIVGGHDRMVAQYKKICKSYKCKVKVFTHMGADFNKQIGCPDLLVLFTNTVSHKMVRKTYRCGSLPHQQRKRTDRDSGKLFCKLRGM